MANGFAYLVLALWPLIAILLYRKKNMQTATLWVIVGGFMLMPVGVGVDLPMVPLLDKNAISVLSALFCCLVIKKQKIFEIKELGKIKYLIALMVVVPFVSAGLNGDAISIGAMFLPGTSYYDGLSIFLRLFILVIVPFFIGKSVFRTYDDQLLMFKFIVVACLIYSLPMLFEVRFSPQLQHWLFGFFPSSFAQQIRFGGFRPVVFMGHGLIVAFFVVVSLTLAAALWKSRIKVHRFSIGVINCYFLVLLVLCKSVASMFYGGAALLFIKSIKPKRQHQIAISFAMIAMFYPAMSVMKIFPHQSLVNAAYAIDVGRGESLNFRFTNEKVLLGHARERLFFGWGGLARNRVYNERTGMDETITDGYWIITLGYMGVLGFIAQFGLMAAVVFKSYSASRVLKSKPDQVLLAAHAILVGIIMIDQIPNASLAPWLWLLVGGLFGRSENVFTNHRT